MARNFWTVLFASAVFAAVVAWSRPGFPATRSGDTQSPPTSELSRLADLDASLTHVLRAQQRRLDSGCEFAATRAHLLAVGDEAIGAIRRLGGLWREGRLRNGGLALSEVLVHDFAALVDEAQRDRALADTLALLEREAREGSVDARALLQRMVEIHPAPPACLTRALQEQGGDESSTASVPEQAIFTDYVSHRSW